MIPAKASARIKINTTLIGISMGVFFFLFSFRPEAFVENKILLLQLILSIPLLFFSSLAYAKVGYKKQVEMWNNYGWFGFATAHAFLINVIGVLSGIYIDIFVAIIFFIVYWALTLIYSFIDLRYSKKSLGERLKKDLYFISLQIIGGIFILLGIL